MATTTATQIQQLYVGLLGRAADQGGLNWWADQVTTGGKTLEDVRASFVTSTEYTTTYGAAATRADLVTSIYQNLFERTPSADEVKYWAETDTRPADQLVAAFIEFAGAADQAVINNKTFVAQTYTDTVGDTNFNAAGAAAAIANVDGTAASVATAVANIASGSLTGQVPGVGLINTLASAVAAEATFETTNKAALDELAVKLNVPVGTSFDTELGLAQTAANKARIEAGKNAAGEAEANTTVLSIRVSDAQKAVEAQRALLNDAGKTAAAKYEAAFAANVAVKGATEAQKAAAPVGLTADPKTSAAFVELAKLPAATVPKTVTDAATLYDFYVLASTTTGQRSAIDTVFKDVPYFATFKATATVDVAKNVAKKAVVDATAGTDATFITKLGDKTAAEAVLVKAQAADVNKAAVDALVTGNDAAAKVVSDAKKALGDYNTTHTDTKTVAFGSTDVSASSTVKEAFYFATKATSADFAIGTAAAANSSFGAGDAIVLGKGYAFNSGDLSSGNNNALEFFFVKTATGTQVVVETANYGSSDVTVNATAGVAASSSDHLAVITLTGVTADHLSVANGVVSYV